MKFKNNRKLISSKKNYIFFLIVGIIVSLFTTMSLVSIPLQVEKEYAEYSDFPDNYCLNINSNSNDLSNRLSNLEKVKYKIFNEINIEETNFKLKNNSNITLIGVEAGFDLFPIVYMNKHDFFMEKCEIIAGSSFNYEDIILHSRKSIISAYFQSELNLDDDEIIINDVRLSITGVLNTSNYSLRHKNDESINIPIYVPMTTFDDIVNGGGIFNVSVYDTKGYSFLEYDEYETFISKEKIDKEINDEIDLRMKNSFVVILSLFVVSILTTSIIQYILLKNKHYEIGIKRAIGASQNDVVFEYLFDYSIFSFLGIFIGVLLGISFQLMLNMPLSIEYRYSMSLVNINFVILSITLYYLCSIVFELISLFFGTRINISNIIVEER